MQLVIRNGKFLLIGSLIGRRRETNDVIRGRGSAVPNENSGKKVAPNQWDRAAHWVPIAAHVDVPWKQLIAMAHRCHLLSFVTSPNDQGGRRNIYNCLCNDITQMLGNLVSIFHFILQKYFYSFRPQNVGFRQSYLGIFKKRSRIFQ